MLPHFPTYRWGENCSALPLIDEPGLSLKAETMPSGTCEAPHYHERARQYFQIQRGTATFQTPEREISVPAGATLLIPAGLPHCISNREPTTLEFLVLSLPSTTDDRITLPEILPPP